jgi:heavy metal sensor kinase
VTFFRSIRARFTGWYLIILAILLVGLGISLHAFLSFTLQRTQDLALESRASQLANSPEARIAIDEGRIEAGLGEVVGFFVASDEGYQVISTRPIEQDLDLTWIDAAFSGNPGFYTVATRDGVLLRFYIALTRSRTGVPPPLGSQLQPRPNSDVLRDAPAESLTLAVVVIGQPMDRTVAALAALRNTLLIAIPLTLLLSAGGGLFLVRKALKPIDRMIETTRGIEEADLGGRVAVESDDELGRLARTLNAMLGRLERAFHRQRQFTDDASHELRSPLSVIAAEATLALRREREASDYRESLSVIAEESVTMNRLIDQLLTLARGDARAEEIEYQQLDLSKLIIETVGVMQPLAEEKRLKLSVTFPAQEGLAMRVIGDETQLKRVLTNLIENAIRHTEPDGEITVSAARSGSTIEWTIIDTGCGISEEHLPHVFERFYRADKARSRQEGGSGLGLAICRLIVEAHHGSISVESELNVGTTFLIQLPSE